jgi:hypothetical protein
MEKKYKSVFSGRVVYDVGGEELRAAMRRILRMMGESDTFGSSLFSWRPRMEQQRIDEMLHRIDGGRSRPSSSIVLLRHCIHVHNPRDPEGKRFTIIEPLQPNPNHFEQGSRLATI